jgi:hypothetical protein
MPILTQVAEAASALRAQLSYVSYCSLPPFLPSSLTRSLTRPLTHSHQPCATPLPPTAQRVVRTAVPAGQRFFDKSERRTHVVASATRTFSKQARFDSANARARIGPKWDRPEWDRPKWDRPKWDRPKWDRPIRLVPPSLPHYDALRSAQAADSRQAGLLLSHSGTWATAGVSTQGCAVHPKRPRPPVLRRAAS